MYKVVSHFYDSNALKGFARYENKCELTQNLSVIRVKCYHVDESVSPERGSDGVSQAEAPQAAEVQGEAVVVGGGGDGHFGSGDADR